MRRRFITLASLIAAIVGVLASPAGAQQLVDAGGEHQGGLAFVLFALMVFIIGFALFFMDRIRRRPTDEDGLPGS
ncbi:MAG: hypothetical protein EXQ79_01825 [Acidimicrobiia bacterium]|nr:hypothetical protein [Acidimicrobiia bacterium]